MIHSEHCYSQLILKFHVCCRVSRRREFETTNRRSTRTFCRLFIAAFFTFLSAFYSSLYKAKSSFVHYPVWFNKATAQVLTAPLQPRPRIVVAASIACLSFNSRHMSMGDMGALRCGNALLETLVPRFLQRKRNVLLCSGASQESIQQV